MTDHHGQRPFHAQRRDWPPKLIERLRATYPRQIEDSPIHVALIHEVSAPNGDNSYEVVGVFKSIFIANQMALEFFKKRYRMFFELSDDWSQFYAFWPSRNYFQSPEGDDNMVGWTVTSSGELWLKSIDGGDGDTYKVHVQLQVVHTNYQPRIIEETEVL
ncbi:hypothetical protein N7540_011901 [Penicillium herquei]|nr:hypothetical protein N7540_011901 [Penicillium herquei]